MVERKTLGTQATLYPIDSYPIRSRTQPLGHCYRTGQQSQWVRVLESFSGRAPWLGKTGLKGAQVGGEVEVLMDKA